MKNERNKAEINLLDEMNLNSILSSLSEFFSQRSLAIRTEPFLSRTQNKQEFI